MKPSVFFKKKKQTYKLLIREVGNILKLTVLLCLHLYQYHCSPGILSSCPIIKNYTWERLSVLYISYVLICSLLKV